MLGFESLNDYHRPMIARLTRLLVIGLLAALAIGGGRTTYKSNAQNIALKPLDLDPRYPGIRRLGGLIFLKAWELGSDNPDFGGISALAALGGGRFAGVSDAGTLIGFGLTSDNRIDRPFIAPLPDSVGPDKSYRDRDSEGIAFDPDSGQFWVSYEANHAVRRFSRSFARMSGKTALVGFSGLRDNQGAETIVRLGDGRFVIIAESVDDGLHQALFYSGDPVEPGTAMTHFSYRPPEGYKVTDGALLPDGRMLLLHRRVGLPAGFSAKLSVLDVAGIQPGAIVEARGLAYLAAPLLVDNMEGVAVTSEGGDTIVWLISDNNFNIWQRTLLMKFRLAERKPNKKPEAITAPGFDSL